MIDLENMHEILVHFDPDVREDFKAMVPDMDEAMKLVEAGKLTIADLDALGQRDVDDPWLDQVGLMYWEMGCTHAFCRLCKFEKDIEDLRKCTSRPGDALEALIQLVVVAEKNIYPKPDVGPDHPWSRLKAAREAVLRLSRHFTTNDLGYLISRVDREPGEEIQRDDEAGVFPDDDAARLAFVRDLEEGKPQARLMARQLLGQPKEVDLLDGFNELQEALVDVEKSEHLQTRINVMGELCQAFMDALQFAEDREADASHAVSAYGAFTHELHEKIAGMFFHPTEGAREGSLETMCLMSEANDQLVEIRRALRDFRYPLPGVKE